MLLHEHPDFVNFIRIVADRRGIREAIVEKDYWVTHILHSLRESEFRDEFIFKGGTSLSKGWGLIDRFSEDVDILLLAGGMGRSAKSKRMKKLQKFVGELPGLRFDGDNLANRSGGECRTSCFLYERRAEGELGALLPYLKIDMGYRGVDEPREQRPIQSMLGEVLAGEGQTDLAANIAAIEMQLLHPKRTFVEKLYAVYSAYESGDIAGKTRHYYDIYRLLANDEVVNFLGTPEYEALKADVARFSVENWPNSPVPDGGRLAGAEAFAPRGEKKTAIEGEYGRSDIYYGQKPSFEEIVGRIGQFLGRL